MFISSLLCAVEQLEYDFLNAAHFDHIEDIKQSIKKDKNIIKKHGYEAVAAAVHNWNEAIVKFLLHHGVNPNAIKMEGYITFDDNSFFRHPLMSAAFLDNIEALKLLIKYKADINFKNEKGDTPLMIAAEKSSRNVVRELLKHNANSNAQNNQGYTALMLAAIYGNDISVKDLIKKRADLNLQDNQGRTALIHAALNGQTYIENMLKAAGANTAIKDKNGKDYRYYAAQLTK